MIAVLCEDDYDDGLDNPAKYVRLAAEIRQLVKSGQLQPGDSVPSIAVLSAERDWARQTCAKALRLLTEEGVLTLFPGSGYHVTRPRRRGAPPPAVDPVPAPAPAPAAVLVPVSPLGC